MIEDYTRGLSYEYLIRRAHKCGRGSRNGAEGSLITNLVAAENGNQHSFLPTKEKQLEAVKKYLAKALDKFLSMKVTEEERETLTYLKDQTLNAYSSVELSGIVETANELTLRFK
nr:hypothetical protein [uncultured Flavobacterium sp.]